MTEYFLDDTDRQVIKYLAENGRISNREIARRLKLTEGTIRARTKRLETEGIIRVSTLVNVERIDGAVMAFLWIDVSQNYAVSEVSKHIADLPDIFLVWSLVGRADILAMTFAKSAGAVAEYVHDTVNQVHGVSRIRYSFTRKIVKHNYQLTSYI